MTSQLSQLLLFCWMKKTFENSSLMHSFITKLYIDRAIFLCPWLKNGFGKYFVTGFISQWIYEKIKTWTLRFPAKENPNM